MKSVLEEILVQEFPDVNGHQLDDQSFIPSQVKLSGNLTSSSSDYPSVTLDDFRSNFDWDEEYTVGITYPYVVYVTEEDSIDCSSKREVVNVLGGSETDWEGGNHSPLDGIEYFYNDYELEVEGIQHSYCVSIRNLRLKESVVKDMNVSGT